MPTLTVTFFFFTLFSIAVAESFSGLDAFLTQQFQKDPLAYNDSYASLPRSLKKSLSTDFPLPQFSPASSRDVSRHTGNSFSSLISSLLSFSVPVSVNVILVGPSSTFPASSPNLLASYITTSLPSGAFNVIAPPNHHLAISHSLHLSVTLAPPSLVSRLSDSLRSALSSSTASLHSSLHPIPFSATDKVIHQEFLKDGADNSGVYIYLISLGSRDQKYAYSYPPGEESGDSSPSHTKCLGNLWTGKERYIWVDLNAGPTDYGPGLQGDGVITRYEFHPFSTLHGKPKSLNVLMADLASLVYSAYKTLLVPSLRIPVHYDRSIHVEFIHIYGGERIDSSGLDWHAIQSEVRNGVLLRGQDLSFKAYKVKYDDCQVCSFAISRSLNSYTSRFLFENYTLIANDYLDSKKLRHIISDSSSDFRKAAGINEDDFSGNILPVYVFDLDYPSLILLDRFHQSISFRDMVIAVRTRMTQTVNAYTCNGRHVFTNVRELERPVVGSLLQSLFGVAPTHIQWSGLHNESIIDYTWSIGQTPFGPFSESPSLSFVQKDAARRNTLLTAMNYSIANAVEILEAVEARGREVFWAKQDRRVEFVRRWNLFKYKMNKAVSAMAQYQFDLGFYYATSSDHDLFALHSLVYLATQELEAALVCFKDPPFPLVSVCVWVLGVVAFCYVIRRRKKIFANKRKQF